MKIYFLIILIPFFPLAISAQYVNDEGDLNTDLIIEKLQRFENKTNKQDSVRNDIILALMRVKKNNPVLNQEKKKRDAVSIAIIQLASKSGKFSFLNPKVHKEQADTVNSGVLELEKKLSDFKDSVNIVYTKLKSIIKNESNTRATRERATFLLGSSNNLDDIKYIFEKHTELTFGVVDINDSPTETFGAERSGMSSLNGYKTRGGRNKLSKNWIIFPFLIEYWGNDNWSNELENTWSEYLSEFALFNNLTHGYEKKWLLVEFMKANASNPDTGIMELIEDEFGQK